MSDGYRRLAAALTTPSARLLAFAVATCVLLAHAGFNRWRQLAHGNEIMLFGSFWESGHAANLGRDPYATYPLVYMYTAVNPPVPEISLNPPSMLPLFHFMAQFDPSNARLAWLLAGAAIFVIGAWAIVRSARPNVFQTAWLLLFPAIPQDLALGQIYALLFALGVAAWLCLRSGRQLAAAACMGLLIAFKPNFGMWCVLALAAGHARPALAAGGVALALTALPAAAHGIEIYQQWLAAVAADRHFLFPSNIALFGFFARMGVPALAYVPVIAIIGWALFWSYRRRPTLYDLTPVAVLVGMLCAPIAWFHYLLIISPFIVDRPWGRAMIAAVVLSVLERFWGQLPNLQGVALVGVSLAAMAPLALMLPVFAARAQRDQPLR